MSELGPILLTISVWAIPVIVAITLHEAAHGWAAWKLGDDTAWMLGRVTFNPLRHIDPVGTVLVPALLYFTGGLLFGWAKPVPVAFHRLRNPRYGMVLVALAGPGMNMALALVSALLLHVAPLLPGFFMPWTVHNLTNSIDINCVLAVFNMLPIPPLDGGRVAVGLLPRKIGMRFATVERYGLLLLVGLIFLLPLLAQEFGYRINPLAWVLGPPVEFLAERFYDLAGLT